MITGELKNRIDSIWNVFWSSGLTNPLTVIEQITYLMFIRILDDNELRREANAASLGAEVVCPTFDAAHQNCRWHIFRSFDPDSMFRNMAEHVFPFIKTELHAGKDTAFARYMKDALFLVPTARVLARVTDALDSLDLNNRDILGDVYEYLLSRIAQSGTNGQFRTPRHIIRMMVELMQPTVGDTVCDPAMGSAGFLCAAAQYVSAHYKAQRTNAEYKKRFSATMFTGFDTDPTMLRIGAMNMMLHGVEAPDITWMDALSADNTRREAYSLIMANPPFTGSLDRETVSGDLLKPAATGKTELLFLALFLKMLKVGGRCASIVPDGVLFGSSKAHKAIRREIVEANRLLAVISMPSGVFKPYAGVSTAILIFTKTGCGGTDKVWFYDMKADGFSLDDKRSPTGHSDIPDIIARFRNLSGDENRARTEQSFFVPKAEIVRNEYDLSIRMYRQTAYTPVEYPPAREILDELDRLHAEIEKETQALRRMLKDGRA